MADASLAQLKTRLNTRLRDTANTTFTSGEKDEMLIEAISDPFVYIADRDTSITTVANQSVYTAPDGFDDIYELGYDYNSDGYAQPIPRDSYDLLNGQIIFRPNAKALASGKTLHVIGKRKLATTDIFPDRVQEYVLELAMVAAFEMLKTSLTTRFVKNDMTMGDIINSINTHKARAAELRRSLINQRLVVL